MHQLACTRTFHGQEAVNACPALAAAAHAAVDLEKVAL